MISGEKRFVSRRVRDFLFLVKILIHTFYLHQYSDTSYLRYIDAVFLFHTIYTLR